MKYDYDVIIVGSGVAGALCAWKLSTLGNHRILILEAGNNGIGEGQRLEFHHAMDRQGSRADVFAPYACFCALESSIPGVFQGLLMTKVADIASCSAMV